MIRRWIRKHTPDCNSLLRQRWARPFAKYLSHPAIWAINRRTVAGAVAAGLFCGLVPGPFQMLAALAWAVVAKVNLPVALIVTLYTNPITIIPLYALALAMGHWILSSPNAESIGAMPSFEWNNLILSCERFIGWFLGFGPSLLVGLFALAFTLAIFGYFLTRLSFFIYLTKRKSRQRKVAPR